MIKTKRLLLKPLNADELYLAINNPNQLDKDMKLTIRNTTLDDHVKKSS